MNIKGPVKHAFNLAACAIGGTFVTGASVLFALQAFAAPPRAQPMSTAADVAAGTALGVGALLLGMGYTRYFGSGKFTAMLGLRSPDKQNPPPESPAP